MMVRLGAKSGKNPGIQGSNRTKDKERHKWRRLEEERRGDKKGRMIKILRGMHDLNKVKHTGLREYIQMAAESSPSRWRFYFYFLS